MRILVRWAFMVLAISAAVYLVPGITLEDDRAVLALVVTALILGLLNAIVRPVLAFLTCGFIVLTLGVGLLFINGLMLYWASWIAQNWFDIGFVIEGYWPAFWGALVISIVSFILNGMPPSLVPAAESGSPVSDIVADLVTPRPPAASRRTPPA